MEEYKKQGDVFPRILVIVLIAVLSWGIFSVLGVVPESMSFPLPSWLKRYNSTLYLTGSTYRNRLKKMSNEAVVEPGTFSGLRLFDNANLQGNCYSTGNNEEIYFGYNDTSYQFSGVDHKFNHITDEEATVILPMDNFDVAISPKKEPAIYHKDVFCRDNSYYKRYFVYNENAESRNSLNDQWVIDALLRSETERITPAELASLVYLVYEERLVYWSYEEQVAMFYGLDAQGVLALHRYDLTKGGTEENPEYPCESISVPDYQSWYVVSKNKAIGYSDDKKSIEIWNLDTGTKEVWLSDLPGLYCLNYCYTDTGELVIGGAVSETEAFWDYTGQDGMCILPIEDEYIIRLSMDNNGVTVLSATNGLKTQLCYYRGSHEKYRAVES